MNTHEICNARVPSTRARSYLVMYGVVMRTSFATAALPVRCLPSGTSPETMMLSSPS